jgi:four helix bundle protein
MTSIPDRTFQFAVKIVKFCQTMETNHLMTRVLLRQLIRSGTSIGANVEEGQASQSKADFLSKYSIACKEARETHYWLRVLTASRTVSPDQTRDLIAECNELICIFTAIIKKVRRKLGK